MPIIIDFLSNASAFLRGTKDVEEALDDVADSLDDVARDSKRTGDNLADGIEDAGRDITRSNERVEASFRGLADTAKKESKQAGDALGREVKDGTSRAKEGVDEFGREAQSTLKETGASFDGTVESGVDAIQEIGANALAGFGAAGVGIGLALAATIGIAISEGQKAADAINQAKERAGELANELGAVDGDLSRIDLGGKFREWGVEIADSREFFEIWQDSAKTNLDIAAEAARRAGGDFTTYFRAMSGLDADDAKKALADNAAAIEANQARIQKLRDDNPLASIFSAAVIADIDNQNGKIAENSKAIEAANAVTADAVATNERLTQATRQETEAAAAAQAAQDLRTQQISSLDAAYDDAAGSVEDYVNKETGIFDTAAYITAMQAREQALLDYQTTLETSSLSPQAKAFIDAQGVDAAATFLAGYASANPEQQAELNRIWTEGGSTASGAFTESLKNGIPGTIPGPTIVPGVDTSAYEAFKRRVQSGALDIAVSVGVAGRTGRAIQ